MKYIVFHKSDQPLIAIPYGISFKHSIKAINCLPSFTLKRKLVKLYLYIISFIGHYINKSIFKYFKSENLSAFLNCSDNFKAIHFYEDLYPVIIWSLVPNRNRYYIHLLDQFGKKIFFIKLTNNKNDFSLLKNESNQLKRIQNIQSKTKVFNVPQVVGFGYWEDYCFLIVQSLKNEMTLFHPAQNNFPIELNKEIKGTIRVINLKDVFNLEWWILLESQRNKAPDLYKYVKNCDVNSNVQVSFVHGDFGSENILIENGVFTIIDWERATDVGPCFVDIVAYWLGKNHSLLKNKSENTIEEFYVKFKDVAKLDLALALCFLVGVNFNLAIIVSNSFNKYT